MENVEPNATAMPRRRNPFKAEDRIAFPPMEEALASRTGGDAEDQARAPDTALCLDLTIGMQSLIHPDSFCEDVDAGQSDESACSEDASVVPSHWNHELESPERPVAMRKSPGTTPLGMGSSILSGSTAGSFAVGGCSGNMTNSPCMADLYMALQAQGNTEEAGDAESTASEGDGTYIRSRRAKRSNSSKCNASSVGSSQEVDFHEPNRESGVSNASSDFADGMDCISMAPSTVNQSCNTQLSQGGMVTDVEDSYGSPVRSAAGQGLLATTCNLSEVGMLPEPAAPGIRTPSTNSAPKSAFSPATPITPASCMKRPGRDGAGGKDGLEGLPGHVGSSRVRFCDGFDDDKFSPIGAAHHTPNVGATPLGRSRHGQAPVNLSPMLCSPAGAGAMREGSGNSCEDVDSTPRRMQGLSRGQGTTPPPRGEDGCDCTAAAVEIAGSRRGEAQLSSGTHTHNSSTSSSSNSSSHSSRRSLLSHPAFYASPVGRAQPSPSCEAFFNGAGGDGKGRQRNEEWQSEEPSRAGGGGVTAGGFGRLSLLDFGGDDVVLEGESAAVRFERAPYYS